MMRCFAGMLAVSGLVVALMTPASSAEPLGNTDQLGAALLACWKPPAGLDGSFVTLKFSFRRDGSLMGAPQVAAANVMGNGKARQKFVDSAVTAIQRCAPLAFSRAFAEGVGGHVFVMQFAVSERQPKALRIYAFNAGSTTAA